MGVPAFFRWLSQKYPSIVVHGIEEKGRQLNDGTFVPVDTSLPNPNDVEFDNLYLDMNGIIHPCCHPEDRPAPRNEEEMMLLIFEYIDRIFRLVRPRRLLYMAIDGTAPRAKMNQQRSRRFRASKEAAEKEEEIRLVRQRLKDEGLSCLNEKKKVDGEKFDSNCITPGTEFMANLARNLRYYIHDRLTNDPGWAKISVILSDAGVSGEGEHKIMDFIRKQRASPDHDPNTHHCLCGADADLIMLGLATHEANFTIVREEFKPNAPRPCELCGQVGHDLKMCNGLPTTAGEDDEKEAPPPGAATEFIFLRLCILREYLDRDLKPDRPISYKFDLERAIDDWVFMCFFVGNDFLPHLPSLEIREGAIDRLIGIYKNNVDRTGGYLTENGFVNYERVQIILTELGKAEDGILRNRMSKAKHFRRLDKERERAKRRREGEDEEGPPRKCRSDGPAFQLDGPFSAQPLGDFGGPVTNARQSVHDARVASHTRTGVPANMANMSSAQKMRAMLVGGSDPPPNPSPVPSRPRPPIQNKDDDDEDPSDVVRLGEDGWKQRYYLNKFAVVVDEDPTFQRQLVRAYVEGLSWVLAYYYQGCPSWNWYYPYHYSPFASDFQDIASLDIQFPTDTKPFNPLEQLMAVFPAASGTFLPKEWRKLMSAPDSPILDFYPSDFCVDLNGKKFAWQGVALLPFVDEDRLLSALAKVYHTLTEEERIRNTRGESVLFAGRTHDVTASLHKTFYAVEAVITETNSLTWLELPADLIYGMSGLTAVDIDAHILDRVVPPPYQSLPTLPVNGAVSVCYQDPYFPVDHRYLAIRLPRAKSPPRVLTGGRAQTGFDPNRQRTNLNPAAHRMLNGAVRDSNGGGRGGGYGGRGGYNGGGGGYNEEQGPIRSYGGDDGREPRRSYGDNREAPPHFPRYNSDAASYSGGSGSYSRQPYAYPNGGNSRGGGYDDRRYHQPAPPPPPVHRTYSDSRLEHGQQRDSRYHPYGGSSGNVSGGGYGGRDYSQDSYEPPQPPPPNYGRYQQPPAPQPNPYGSRDPNPPRYYTSSYNHRSN